MQAVQAVLCRQCSAGCAGSAVQAVQCTRAVTLRHCCTSLIADVTSRVTARGANTACIIEAPAAEAQYTALKTTITTPVPIN